MKRFDEETKLQIIEDRLNGMKMKELEAKYNCNEKYIQRLMKKSLNSKSLAEKFTELALYENSFKKYLMKNFQQLIDEGKSEEDLAFAAMCISKCSFSINDLVKRWDALIDFKNRHPDYVPIALNHVKKLEKELIK